MILAETIQFTPEESAALLFIGAVILAVLLGAVALAVAGIVCGFRHGRDATRTKARAVWVTAVVLESVPVVPLLATDDPMLAGPCVLAAAVTVAAWWLGTAFAARGDRY